MTELIELLLFLFWLCGLFIGLIGFVGVLNGHSDALFFVLAGAAICVLCLVMVTDTQTEENNIETVAVSDYQNYLINETKFIESQRYRDKILQLHKNEIEIYPGAKLKDRFCSESDYDTHLINNSGTYKFIKENSTHAECPNPWQTCCYIYNNVFNLVSIGYK